MIKVLVQYWNCEQWLQKCINSIQTQADVEFECHIADDMSTDGSVAIVKEMIKDDPRFTFTQRTEKYWQVRNYYEYTHEQCEDEDIIVHVDGDDWLANKFVLRDVQKDYDSDPELWIAYGQFQFLNGTMGFSAPVEDWDNIRYSMWTTSHLRTYKAWLFNLIKEKDCKYFGEWTECTGDKFILYPMLEMAGKEHTKFVPDVRYIYNDQNPLNEHKTSLQKQISAEHYVRALTPYERIEK